MIENMISAKFVITCISVLIVSYVLYGDLQNTSPGKLTAAHAQVRDLRMRDGCNLCHGETAEHMAVRCQACHETISAQIRDRKGFHGTITTMPAKNCAACHTEHNGRTFAIVSQASFALAGVPDVEKFDHGHVDFRLSGRHDELACVECHKNANVDVLETGRTRFLGLDQECTTCHDDPHEGRMVRSCASCHGQELPFSRVGAFVHDERFPLVDSHSEASCRDCHAKDDLHSIESLDSMTSPATPRTCADCHASPHRTDFVEGVAQLLHEDPARTCSSCHQVADPAFKGAHVTITREAHAATGFSLVAPHDKVRCKQCHDQDLPQDAPFEARFPGRDPRRCESCHADPHGGQFEKPRYELETCLSCHLSDRFEPAMFDVSAHQRTRFPLTGSHLEVKCKECHLRPENEAEEPRTFVGTASDCASCHQDPHDGKFDGARHGLGPFPGGECARCHDTTSFDQVSAGRFEHGLWTGFELLGAHGQTRCEACHGKAQGLDDGLVIGRVTDVFPGPVGHCSTCHEDPHAGAFDRPGLPGKVDGRTDCARCHQAISFRSLVEEAFEHETWTGFALRGAHAKARCSACHSPLEKVGPDGRQFAFAHGTDCASCHEDPHAGQFEREGRTECSRCHMTDETFKKVDFDHQNGSRFPLDETHEKLACSACHLPTRLKGGGKAVRFKPLGTECRDCHGFKYSDRDEKPTRKPRAGRRGGRR